MMTGTQRKELPDQISLTIWWTVSKVRQWEETRDGGTASWRKERI